MNQYIAVFLSRFRESHPSLHPAATLLLALHSVVKIVQCDWLGIDFFVAMNFIPAFLLPRPKNKYQQYLYIKMKPEFFFYPV